MTARPPIRSDTEQLMAQVARLTAAVEEMRVDLLRGLARMNGDEATPALLRAILEHVGDRTRSFSAREVIDYSKLRAAATLREALTAALGGPNARALGKLFERIEGYDIDGMVIEQISSKDRDGATWVLRVCHGSNPQSPLPAPHCIIDPAG